MSNTTTEKVPDIGDFEDVPVIEILVAVGDQVEAEQPLVTLESDKATMDVPASTAGTIVAIHVTEGQNVKEGSALVDLQREAEPAKTSQEAKVAGAATETTAAKASAAETDSCEVLVLGSGPGGYTAAFRAADLGLDVVLVERYPDLGGVCLNVGCIPSKALLHAAKVIDDAAAMAAHGVSFGEPDIDIKKLGHWRQGVVKKLTQGLAGMARQRKVRVWEGYGEFTGPHTMAVEGSEGTRTIQFKKAIIAAGSQPVKLPGLPWEDPRLMDSTDALELADVPERLLVVGGGIIGMEMACVYAGLGSKVTVVELMDQLMPGADLDLVRPFQKFIGKRLEGIHLGCKVTGIEPATSGLNVSFEGPKPPEQTEFDRVLVSVGRTPNGSRIGAEKAGVEVTDRGFINVDKQMRTNVEHIFAIGDIVGQPMLAHKATHEAKVAAEVCAGHKSGFDALVIPSVAYTDPEVAWVGLTENEAKAQGITVGKGQFPWAASGRALGLDRTEGTTKLLFDPETKRVLGAGIVGPGAGDLIAEVALAIEMGCDAEDIGLTIHPHPTLSETVAMAAEVFEGTITDLYIPKRKGK